MGTGVLFGKRNRGLHLHHQNKGRECTRDLLLEILALEVNFLPPEADGVSDCHSLSKQKRGKRNEMG